MGNILLVILLFGCVYVWGMYTSPNVEIENISEIKDRDNISENLMNTLKQKRGLYLVKVLTVSIIIFMIITNFLYTQDEAITYLLSVIVASILINEYERV